MKKLNKWITVVLLTLFVLTGFFGDIVQATLKMEVEHQNNSIDSTGYPKKEESEKESEEQNNVSSESLETNSTYESSEGAGSFDKSGNSENSDDLESSDSSDVGSTYSIEKSQPDNKEIRAGLQDSDHYWLVSSAPQLWQYLSEGKKQLRLTNDIDLGSVEYKLSDGVVIDGGGFTITYDKGMFALTGFNINESNATVTIKNVTFGNERGTGATGQYGIVTGNFFYSNITLIFENIVYISKNGQPLYNPNGKILFRGENKFIQTGLGLNAQEWAETNYIEIQSGTTTVQHRTLNGLGFIYSESTVWGNPYRNSAQVVVKKDATFDVTTNHAFFNSNPNFALSILVEENGHLNITQTETTNTIKNRFIYPDLSAFSSLTFDFKENSSVNLDLKLPIQVKNAKGAFLINRNATVNMIVGSGSMFDVTSKNQFNLALFDPKKADFSGTGQGTFGLASDSVTYNSLVLSASNSIRVESYLNSQAKLGDFETPSTTLNINGMAYRNYLGSTVSLDNLRLLEQSNRLVFSRVQVPKILATDIINQTEDSARLSITSENYDSPAKEVKYLLFNSLKDTGILKKAKHIENITQFKGQNTANVQTYEQTFSGLNPNTTYWFQGMVTSQNGRSTFSNPIGFSTKAMLNNLLFENLTAHSVILKGSLASDTGVWTDFSNGEENPIKNKVVDYGGTYTNLSFEYSKDEQFGTYQIIKPTLNGNKNQIISSELKNLDANTTYYVRIRGTSVSGEEFILSENSIMKFTTQVEEIIDVEIPLEMTFQTKNKDLGTKDSGVIYSQRTDYQAVNKGNTSVKMSVSNFQKKNEAAKSINLIKSIGSFTEQDALHLKLLGSGKNSFEINLTEELQQKPILIGELNTTDHRNLKLDFSGKFLNPLKPMLTPKYQMTFKFERMK